MASEKPPIDNSGNVPKAGTSSTYFFPPEVKHKDIRRRLLKGLRGGEYAQLKKELTYYQLTNEKITAFFLSDDGKEVLRWSLIQANTAEPLKFLTTIVPKVDLFKVLNHDNFSMFRTFLCTELNFEKFGWYTSEVEKVQIDKFKTLLEIDKEAIVGFMEENGGDKSLISTKVTANFENAVKQLGLVLRYPSSSTAS